MPELRAIDYLDRALQKRWISFEDFASRVQQRSGKRGTRKLIRLVRLVSGGAQFEAERRLVGLLHAQGTTGWECNHAVLGVGVIDVAFPGIKLAIEVDGMAWHSDARRFQADRTKQNALVSLGWTVLRFTWRDLVDRPENVMTAIRTTAERLERGRAS